MAQIDMTGNAANELPRFSVIVNTDGRASALRKTIESFRHLDYSTFEVIIVAGPTPDGTRELGREYAEKGWVKYIECPERNLSRSRNLGIKHANGEIVAFIDDDAIPEPEWLKQLTPAFETGEVGGAGGVVFDHTGYSFQYRFAACDRLGNAILDVKEGSDEYSFPFSARFAYVQGTNCAFRRTCLVAIGGFDEEYEFYLDETDVCCRLVDAGLKIRQLPDAAVHHKFLPSHVRNEHRVTTVKFPVIKNKIYFSLVNNHGHHPLTTVLEDALRFISMQRSDLEFHLRGGRLRPIDLEAFDDDVERALDMGLQRGLSRKRLTRPADYFDNPSSFRAFPRLLSDGPRRTFVFLSQSYPPAHAGGNARHTHDIARAISALGHTTHVLTLGADFNRVDFEEGVWVHRIVPKMQFRRALPDGTVVPERIWNLSATHLEEIYRISKMRRVDVIEGVSWDCECIAIVLDGRFPSATNIVTTLSHWLDTHPEFREDSTWMETFGEPMLAIERFLFEYSPGIVSASRAIAESIGDRYKISFRQSQITYAPHGLIDVSPLPRHPIGALMGAGVPCRPAVLFVGRLELRKGIDVFLESASIVLAQHPNAEFWIAGDDTLEVAPGATIRRNFERSNKDQSIANRVRFLGRVDDAELRWLYANCDVFVSPSRFESFGLIFVEAMMFGKPCIGCRAGGMSEVIEEEETGLLVEPGDVMDLARALNRLLSNQALRDRMGKLGRARYIERFEASVAARRRVEFLASLIRVPVYLEWSGENPKRVGVGFGEEGWLLSESTSLVFYATAPAVFVTFWKHDWSGIVEILIENQVVLRRDLYEPLGCFETIMVPCQGNEPVRLSIRRPGAKRDRSQDSEVIVVAVDEGRGSGAENLPSWQWTKAIR